MMDRLYRVMTEIYGPEFMTQVSIVNPEWKESSLTAQEEYLRHQKVCVLLANTEVLAEAIEEQVNKPFDIDGAEEEIDLPPTLALAAETVLSVEIEDLYNRFLAGPDNLPLSEQPMMFASSSDEEDTSRMEIGGLGDDPDVINFDTLDDDDEDNEADFEWVPQQDLEIDPEIDRSRICLIETSVNGREWQGIFSRKHGLSIPSKMYDLFDQKEKKFIEVKVTSNPEHILALNMQKVIEDKAILCIANLNTLQIEYHNAPGHYTLPGELKAREFLGLRQRRFIAENIMADINDTRNKSLCECLPAEILHKAEMWFGDILTGVSEAPRPFKHFDINLDNSSVHKVLDFVNDPRLRECPKSKWKGKLIPIFMKSSITSEETKDLLIIQEVFRGKVISDTLIQNESESFLEAVKTLIVKISEASSSMRIQTVNYSKPNNVPESVLQSLGVFMKRTKADYTKKIKQKDYGEHKIKADPEFFSRIIRETAKKHEGIDVSFKPLLSEDLPVNHPIDRMSTKICKEVLDVFSKSKVSMALSEWINFSSRMGGHYLVDDQKGSTHSTIAAWPLYYNIYRGMETLRNVTGIIIRGPHHARTGTDRTNFIVGELINEEGLAFCKEFVASCVYLKFESGEILVFRRNASDRASHAFWSYGINIMMPVTNVLADRIFKTLSEFPESQVDAVIEKNCRGYDEFYSWKLSEAFYWMTQANSECEGMMAIMRKLVVKIISQTMHGKDVAFFDYKGLCDKMNECVISSPLCMYYVSSFIDYLQFSNEKWGGSFTFR